MINPGPLRRRPQSVWVPPSRGRLVAGIAIGILGPLMIATIARSGSATVFPGVPYVLIVVAAAVVGRLVASGVAIAVSVVMLERYLNTSLGVASDRTEQEIVSLLVFVIVGVVVSQLVARLAQTVDAEARERDRLRFLAAAGDAMSRSIAPEDTLNALSEILVPSLADWFAVDLVDEGLIRSVLVVHPDRQKVELARELQSRFPVDPDALTGPPHVIATGKSELIETISDEMLAALVSDPDVLKTMRSLQLHCAMVVPLTARGRTLGALTLIGAEHHEHYGPEDLQLAEEIADRAALAIDTAQLFAAENDARTAASRQAHRNGILKDATAAFGQATSVDAVLKAMLDTGIRKAGAAAGTVGLVEGETVDVIGISGYELDDHPFWHSFSVDATLPMAEAIRERMPTVVSTTEERDRRYPSLRGRGEQADHVLVCLPLLLGGVAIGGFSASYPPGTDFDEDDLSFLTSLGEQCAQAVDRASAREGAARTQARFDALASVSSTLALSLDLDVTAATAVALAAQHLGERARIFELGPDGFTAIADSAAEGGISEIDSRPHVEIERVLEGAVAEASPTVVPGTSEGSAPSLVLPLSIASTSVGALLVDECLIDVRDRTDLQFATEAARRMARALENSRLYREKAYVARTLQASLLPPSLPEVPGVEIDAVFLPALRDYQVGGDFYDVFQTEDGSWAAVVGDVCGKGIEAAALTGLARHTLHALAAIESPSDILSMLNRTLLREDLDGRFCTVAFAKIEPSGEGGVRVRLALGGHPMPQRISIDGEATSVGEPGTLLGVTDDVRLKEAEFFLEPGEVLLMFTDGLLRKSQATGEEPDGPAAMFRAQPPSSATEAGERVRRYVADRIADDQFDDVAALVIRATTDVDS